MKIGIDLDNTIISYDSAFQDAAYDKDLIDGGREYNKKDLSREIKSRENGEIEWQRLQGFVYGKGIEKAHVFPGVYRFLWRCYNRGIVIEIVSHKTEYGHFDTEKRSLRKSATNFLKEHKILQYDSEINCEKLISKITFTDTQQDKINYISDNNFDYFIDDLEEIVKSKQLNKIQTVLFNCEAGSSWDEITDSLLNSWTEEEMFQLFTELLPEKNIVSIEKLEGRANSEIHKIYADKKIYISKLYPQSGKHNRLLAEYSSLELLKDLAIPYIQTAVTFDDSLGVAVYDYIEGEKISNSDGDSVQQMLLLLNALESKEVKDRFFGFNLASNACLSGVDIENQIKGRLKNLEAAIEVHAELNSFIYNRFMPAFNKLLVWSKKRWPNSFMKDLTYRDLVLSPSDFGFHNAIKDSTGKLFFHDFEYFGWDDPVKLISDVTHHAAFELTEEQEQLWVNGCLKIYGGSILNRYRAAWPLYGLVWCLIVLNEYNDIFWGRRIKAIASLKNKRERLLLTQLNKANNQLNKVLGRYEKI